LGEVIVIVGPTCSGKTRLSLEIAKGIKSEIISADSRQIFKHLDIGTAKPAKSELEKVKHHFIDELDPGEDFNVSLFAAQAEEIIQKLIEKNVAPVVVGGSGLYVKALIDGISESADADQEIRAELLELRHRFGNEYLYNELEKVDNISASKMLPQNWKRVMRALEVFRLTGKPIWKHHHEQNINLKFDFKQIGLLWDRKTLYQNIELRVDEMIETGLVKEVKNLLDLGYSKKLNALNTVGYKEIIQFLENQISLDRAIDLIKRNTRHYAKRQMTWFNKDKRISWYQINQQSDLINVSKSIIKSYN
jgi:tRNA dimethylallyltransferase